MKAIYNYITEKLKISDNVINRKTLPIDDVTPIDKTNCTLEEFRKAILDYQFYRDELSFDLTQIFGNKLPIFRQTISIKELEAEVHKKNCVICVLDKDFSYASQSFKRYTVDRIELLATLLGEDNVKLGNGIIDCIYEYISNKILNESAISEKLHISKDRNNGLNDNDKFKYNEDSGLLSGRHTFIHDYYLERVKIDGYTKLEDFEEFNIYFVSEKLYYQRKNELTRYLIVRIEDGDTFGEVYDRVIDFFKKENIIS